MLNPQTKTDLQSEIIELQALKAGLLNELLVVHTDIREAKEAAADVYNRERLVEQRIVELEKQESDSLVLIKKEVELEKAKLQSIKDEEVALNMKAAGLESKIIDLQTANLKLNAKNQALNEENESLHTINFGLHQEQRELIGSIEQFKSNLESLVKSQTDLQIVIEAQKMEIEQRDKNIQEREASLNQREADLKIYEARVRAEFAKVFPHLTINL